MSTGRILMLVAAFALSVLASVIVYDRLVEAQYKRHETGFQMEVVKPDAPATYLNETTAAQILGDKRK